MEDVGVQESTKGQTSLFVDPKLLGFARQAIDHGPPRAVSPPPVGQKVLETDPSVRANLVEGDLALLQETDDKGP